jgi:hypothetical protein
MRLFSDIEGGSGPIPRFLKAGVYSFIFSCVCVCVYIYVVAALHMLPRRKKYTGI